MITVILSKAILCINLICYPALIGDDTKPGTYELIERFTESDGYDGSVLQYKETYEYVYAIHKIWNGRPIENRNKRIKSSDVTERQHVTKGCINVENEVYDILTNCCNNDKLIITN
jgi:hypothetical protein